MDKKYCSYCNYFDMDTSRFPIRYTCVLHKVRIVKDEQAEQCPDFKRLADETGEIKPVQPALLDVPEPDIIPHWRW